MFKYYDKIDEAWENICAAMTKDELGGCVTAKCSTMRYNPTGGGTGPSMTAVICVYTEEHNMDAVGFKLIEIVRQDIRYKTDASTLSFKYSHSSEKVSSKTIYWNSGKPSFVRESKPSRGKSPKKEDIWHVNVVTAPEPISSEDIRGRWILNLEYPELTDMWHYLKGIVESKEKNFGIIKMVCPRSPRREKPVFQVYTGKEGKTVGMLLIEIVHRDIDYEQYPDMPGAMERLFWNDGSPDYEEVECKGIKRARREEEL